MGIPSVAPPGSDAYRKVQDDGSGTQTPPKTPDSDPPNKDPFEDEINSLPEGPLKDALIFLRNSAGGV